jgi:hypothetical protein
MKVLLINSGIHEKNKQGIIQFLNLLQEQKTIEYKIGTIDDISNYDVIYNPSELINTANYPTKKFIFGPHFSVFPNHEQLNKLQNNVNKNSIYIQPSEWTSQVWKNMGAEQIIPIKIFPFPVNTEKFAPHSTNTRNNVLVYYKNRSPRELNKLKEFIDQQKITNYRLFSYKKRYNENDYLTYLQTCKYGIILDAHESQGFAIEEALSCNVPLLVWSAQTMNQEDGSNYNSIPCTSIPYWDSKCGEYFHHLSELPSAFQTFQEKLTTDQYNPRQYILETLSTEKCAERFMALVN